MTEGALSDIKVIDLTHYIAGPYCTKLLADYGADVIKVEKPGEGDPARRMGPFPDDEPHPEKSGLFIHLNTNKRGITLNLRSMTGKKIFRQLIKDADIVVENFRPGVMKSFGLDYEALAEVNPRLVMTSISNFGQTGPYRDFKASDIVLYGMGGEMLSSGIASREPVRNAPNVVQYEGGTAAAAATMGAFYFSRYGGVGQYLDIAINEIQSAGMERRACTLLAYQYTGEFEPRIEGSGGYPTHSYPCKDGYFACLGGLQNWDKVCRLAERMGDTGLLKDPKWKAPTAQANPALREEFEALWIGWLMQYTGQELMEMGQAAGLSCAKLNTVGDLLTDPHFKARQVFVEYDHPMAGRIKGVGQPFLMGETPWQLRRPAPLLGQHNAEVYTGMGYSKEDLVMLRQTNVI